MGVLISVLLIIFFVWQGTGLKKIGKRDFGRAGEYTTTEWFVVFFFPIFPVCSYRVSPAVEKMALHTEQVIMTYSYFILMYGVIGFFGFLALDVLRLPDGQGMAGTGELWACVILVLGIFILVLFFFLPLLLVRYFARKKAMSQIGSF